jgi:hypothetical protein
MSVQIQMDAGSLAHFNKQMNILKSNGKIGIHKSLVALGMKIKTTAQLRLRGKGHIDTSRLRNSIFVKANPEYIKKGNESTYENDPKNAKSESGKNQKKQTWDSDLKSVAVSEMEIAVGTNVEYANDIERLDSYLEWSLNNVDIEQSVTKDMQDYMKFGMGIIQQPKK